MGTCSLLVRSCKTFIAEIKKMKFHTSEVESVLCHFSGWPDPQGMRAHIMQMHLPVLSLLCHLRVMLSTRGVFFGPHPMHHVYCLLACIILQLTIRYSYKTIFFILFPFSNANGVIGFSFNPFFSYKIVFSFFSLSTFLSYKVETRDE